MLPYAHGRRTVSNGRIIEKPSCNSPNIVPQKIGSPDCPFMRLFARYEKQLCGGMFSRKQWPGGRGGHQGKIKGLRPGGRGSGVSLALCPHHFGVHKPPCTTAHLRCFACYTTSARDRHPSRCPGPARWRAVCGRCARRAAPPPPDLHRVAAPNR